MEKKKRKNKPDDKNTDFTHLSKSADKGSDLSKKIIGVVIESSGTNKKVVEVTIEPSEEKIDLAEFIEAVLDFEDG